MFWTVLGILRLFVTAAALTTVGFDIDWLPLRLTVVALGLVTAVLRQVWLHAEKQRRMQLIKALAATRQPGLHLVRREGTGSCPPAGR